MLVELLSHLLLELTRQARCPDDFLDGLKLVLSEVQAVLEADNYLLIDRPLQVRESHQSNVFMLEVVDIFEVTFLPVRDLILKL